MTDEEFFAFCRSQAPACLRVLAGMKGAKAEKALRQVVLQMAMRDPQIAAALETGKLVEIEIDAGEGMRISCTIQSGAAENLSIS